MQKLRIKYLTLCILQHTDGDETTSSSEEESLVLSDHDSEFSSSEESVIMLTYPDRHQPRSVSAQGQLNDVASINSQNQSEHIDIIQVWLTHCRVVEYLLG